MMETINEAYKEGPRPILSSPQTKMIAKLQTNRVRRSYLGGSRIDAFCQGLTSQVKGPRSKIDNSSGKKTFDLRHSTCDLPGGVQPRPEDWLASTTQAFHGTIEIEGEGLGQLEDGRLVRDAIGDLPILVKLLDSDERLVVQAHPTVPCAQRLFRSPVGKTECWYFLPGTAPDACVYLGFKPGISRETWERAVLGFRHKDHKERKEVSAPLRLCVDDNPLLSYLHRIPVAPGDFVFVDGGVPHAIGGGCFMIELQEPSDLMVVAERFTPSGRRIPDAKMHGGVGWDRMFDVYEYEGRTYEETCERYVRRAIDNVGPEGHLTPRSGILKAHSADLKPAGLICGPEFTDKFEMWRLADTGAVALSGASAVAVVTDGIGSLNGLSVKRGDRLVVSGEASIRAEGALSAIVCFRRIA